jgi:hypothetical protein
MAFKTSDFKKTTRKTGDTRQLYPYQIRDDRYTAALGFAINYFERMVGRRRADFETDTLLEFFGDPRLARGLVACLSRTYTWRTQNFSDAFGDETAQALWRAGLPNPATLRRKLYGLANGRYSGVILPHERPEALDFLCSQLTTESPAQLTAEHAESAENQKYKKHSASSASFAVKMSEPPSPVFTPAQFERGLTLDTEQQQVLMKLGPTPTAEAIIAAYNYHSLETALCHAESVRLSLRGPVWPMIRSVHNLARRYRLRYRRGEWPRSLFDDRLELTLFGGRDALGNWSRIGRRLVRALLRLLAAHPDAAYDGEAGVHLNGQTLTLKLDERALRVLGVAARAAAPDAGEAWDEAFIENFRRAWSRALVGGRSRGWRLRRDPEPIIGKDTVVVPDFAMQRGNQRALLCLASGRATADALIKDIGSLGKRTDILLVVPSAVALVLPSCPVPLATYDETPGEAVPALVRLLERAFPRLGVAATLTPWQRLEGQLADEGFVSEEAAAELLGCPTGEVATVVRRWGGVGLHALPGLGICTPDSLDEIRQLIEEGVAPGRAA